MPRKGDVIKGYKVVRRIGRGSFGDVFLVETISSPWEKYAMKIVPDTTVGEEMKIGLTLSKKCPFLVKFKEVFSEEEDMFIVMEYYDGGDLLKRLESKKPLIDLEIYCFLHNSIMALKTLHDAGIIHRDIKPSNFFLGTNGEFKLGDYGTARVVSLQTMTRTGTEGYICPEILNGDGKYTSKADIYSLGVTLMYTILGHSPFSPSADAPISVQLAMLGTPIESLLNNPHPVMQLARRMISVDPAARPTADEVLAFPLLTVASIARTFTSAVDAGVKVQIEKYQKELEARQKELESHKEENERLQKKSEAQQKEIDELRKANSEFPIVFGPNPNASNVTYSGLRVIRRFTSGWDTVCMQLDLSIPRIYLFDALALGYVAIGIALKSIFHLCHSKHLFGFKETCGMIQEPKLGWS